MNILKPCTSGERFQTEWTSAKLIWKKLGENSKKDCYEQNEKRLGNNNDTKLNERGENTIKHLRRTKLVKGLTAEWYCFYVLKTFGFKVDPPRNEGASWEPDLYSRESNETFEIKCTEGELKPNWKKEVRGLKGKEKHNYYNKNSPSYFFQYGDKNGKESKRNTDPIFRKLSKENDYLVLVRKRNVFNKQNKHVDEEYKISSIIKKNDVTLDLDKYFQKIDWSTIRNAKRRLVETQLIAN